MQVEQVQQGPEVSQEGLACPFADKATQYSIRIHVVALPLTVMLLTVMVKLHSCG